MRNHPFDKGNLKKTYFVIPAISFQFPKRFLMRTVAQNYIIYSYVGAEAKKEIIKHKLKAKIALGLEAWLSYAYI